MYLVPILMLLFIGSLVVILICLRVRGCDVEFTLFGGASRSTNGSTATSATNGNGNANAIRNEIGKVRNQVTKNHPLGGVPKLLIY